MALVGLGNYCELPKPTRGVCVCMCAHSYVLREHAKRKGEGMTELDKN